MGVADGCCGNIVEIRVEKVARFLRKLGPARFVFRSEGLVEGRCLNAVAKSGNAKRE